MDLKYQAPKDVDGVSIENQQFDADLEGVIVAPLRLKEKLLEMGFRVIGPAPEKKVAEKAEGKKDK